MSGATVTSLPLKKNAALAERVMMTPAWATDLLNMNRLNRPLNDQHVKRLANQILTGKWRFNGDSIKIAETDDVLDGQHRLNAIILANKSVEMLMIYGIEREAFSTIDTLRKPRSASDVLALGGATRYRNIAASALQWLIRWQRGCIEDFRAPQNRVENSDVEAAFAAHPSIVGAAEQAMRVNKLANASIVAFFYYVLTNRNPRLADRMIETLHDPSGVAISDPFYNLRVYFATNKLKTKSPIVTIALMIKAANAAAKGKKMETLSWKHQGKVVEVFPKLDV